MRRKEKRQANKRRRSGGKAFKRRRTGSQRFKREVEEELLDALVEARDARGSGNVLDLGIDEGNDVLERTTDVSKAGDLPFSRSNVVGVQVSIFQTREPSLHRRC